MTQAKRLVEFVPELQREKLKNYYLHQYTFKKKKFAFHRNVFRSKGLSVHNFFGCNCNCADNLKEFGTGYPLI